MITTSEQTKSQVLTNVRNALSQFKKPTRLSFENQFSALQSRETPRPVVDGVLLEHFVDKLTEVKGTFEIVDQLSQVPAAIKTFLDRHKLPTQMVSGTSDLFSEIDWPADWMIEHRSAQSSDQIAVTDAVCGIAEAGSIVCVSSPNTSSTHMFLPENHIVVLKIGQLVRHLEDALQMASMHLTQSGRAVHIITGPSKTADVEQTIQYGAHGPRRLHAVVVGSST